MNQVEQPQIQPRTAAERWAYLAGYAAAINDVSDEGSDFAKAWLKIAYESEERIADK